MTADEAAPTADDTRLWVKPWPDVVIDRLGHDPRSMYVERFWLGILGPSTTWFLRYVVAALDNEPDGLDLDLDITAASLGLGNRHGRHSPFMRAIDRACQFGLARREPGSDPVLAVRRRVAPLTQAQVRRLPMRLQHEHADLLQRQVRTGDELEQRRARRLALTLLEVGDGPAEAERRLHDWGLRIEAAGDAVRWAFDRHARARAATGGDAA